MAINKVKLPNGNTENIQDSRISGVDSAPTSGSGNLVTSGGVKTALDGYLPLTGGNMDANATVKFGSGDSSLSLGWNGVAVGDAHLQLSELQLEDDVDARKGGLRVDDENMHGFYRTYDYTFPKATGTLALTSDINTAVSGKENVSNKVTSLSSSSTDVQYPSAKATYDAISAAGIKASVANRTLTLQGASYSNRTITI